MPTRTRPVDLNDKLHKLLALHHSYRSEDPKQTWDLFHKHLFSPSKTITKPKVVDSGTIKFPLPVYLSESELITAEAKKDYARIKKFHQPAQEMERFKHGLLIETLNHFLQSGNKESAIQTLQAILSTDMELSRELRLLISNLLNIPPLVSFGSGNNPTIDAKIRKMDFDLATSPALPKSQANKFIRLIFNVNLEKGELRYINNIDGKHSYVEYFYKLLTNKFTNPKAIAAIADFYGYTPSAVRKSFSRLK